MPETRWALTVVRGRTIGAVFPLAPGETVLGAAPPNGHGLNLADQEIGAVRRLADAQAAILCEAGRATVRDLESPAGTFVNRRRVLPGQAKALDDGDIVDLGGVRLKVVATDPDAQPEDARRVPARPPEPYRVGQAVCPTWDDLLTLSAQRWQALVDDVESGRLAAYLERNGLPPLPAAGSSAERLDAWLSGLPTDHPARPELDVHPSALVCRHGSGGTFRRELTISNVGYRLLRGTVEVPDLPWIGLPSGEPIEPFVVAESQKLTLLITPPADDRSPLHAGVRIRSDGGERWVDVRVEEPVAAGVPDDALAADSGPGSPWLEAFSRRSPGHAALAGAGFGLQVGLALVLGGYVADGLAGPLAVGAAGGMLLAATAAIRKHDHAILPASATAGGIAGAMLMTTAHALATLVPMPLGRGGVVAALAAWGALGAVVGWGLASRKARRCGGDGPS